MMLKHVFVYGFAFVDYSKQCNIITWGIFFSYIPYQIRNFSEMPARKKLFMEFTSKEIEKAFREYQGTD